MASMDVDFDSLEARDSDIASSAAHPETARLLSELDRRQLARKIALPTNDGEVRARLRDLDEPITLFGEGPADRRDRLRDLIAKARLERGEAMDVEEEEESESESEESEKEEEFYTEGPTALKAARRDIAEYSLPRCASPLSLSLPLPCSAQVADFAAPSSLAGHGNGSLVNVSTPASRSPASWTSARPSSRTCRPSPTSARRSATRAPSRRSGSRPTRRCS